MTVTAETKDAIVAEALDLALRIRTAKPSFYSDVALCFDRHGGGPEIVLRSDDVDGREVARLCDLAGTNWTLELHDGRLRLTSSTWPPDRIPF